MAITIGIPSALQYRTIIDRLGSSNAFTVVPGSTVDVARQLREHHVDAAILSPIDFGKDSSQYCAIRHGLVVSSTPTNTISLHFQSSLHTISTIAVHPAAVSEIVLARILLGEEFEVEPSFVPVAGSLNEMLKKADGALLTDNESRMVHHDNHLDLVEAWTELTGLPFVHGILCTREEGIPDQGISAIVSALGSNPPADADPQTADYLSSFACRSDGEAIEALREFLHYAYYYGILPDVGEMRILPFEESERTTPFSVN